MWSSRQLQGRRQRRWRHHRQQPTTSPMPSAIAASATSKSPASLRRQLRQLRRVSIKLAGGKGKDKTFTVTEGSQTFTQTFTDPAQWDDAKATGARPALRRPLRQRHPHVIFDVDFDTIEDVPDTAGVGTSVIEKNVNLQRRRHQRNGEMITRDGLNALGTGKLAERRERLRLRFRHRALHRRRATDPPGVDLRRRRQRCRSAPVRRLWLRSRRRPSPPTKPTRCRPPRWKPISTM